MPADPVPAGSPADWLRHAQADLALAEVQVSPQLLELQCFHAQQACEKSLKAVLVFLGVPVLKTHNLRTLLDAIAAIRDLPSEIEACADLTDYAVTTRYPGVYEPVTIDEHLNAVRMAAKTAQWAHDIIQGIPPT